MGDWSFFFFNDTATTEIYTLSLHDALPISCFASFQRSRRRSSRASWPRCAGAAWRRSEEHTFELQSRGHLVCRLLLEKKNYLAVGNGDLQIGRGAGRGGCGGAQLDHCLGRS